MAPHRHIGGRTDTTVPNLVLGYNGVDTAGCPAAAARAPAPGARIAAYRRRVPTGVTGARRRGPAGRVPRPCAPAWSSRAPSRSNACAGAAPASVPAGAPGPVQRTRTWSWVADRGPVDRARARQRVAAAARRSIAEQAAAHLFEGGIQAHRGARAQRVLTAPAVGRVQRLPLERPVARLGRRRGPPGGRGRGGLAHRARWGSPRRRRGSLACSSFDIIFRFLVRRSRTWFFSRFS
jgi:hypothetical protein